MTTANWIRLAPDYFDGAAIFAGSVHPSEMGKEGPDGSFDDKPLFIYQGTNDVGFEKTLAPTVKFFKSTGANMEVQNIRDFDHVFPNNLPEHDVYNKFTTCANGGKDLDKKYVVGKNKRLQLLDKTLNGEKNCGYNLAYYAIKHLQTAKKHPQEFKDRDLDYTNKGRLMAFNQKPYSTKEAKMNDHGYVYIPNSCWDGEYCTLHVHLHGCMQSSKIYEDTYIRGLGLMEYAATNNIIMLFPQNDDEFRWVDKK